LTQASVALQFKREMCQPSLRRQSTCGISHECIRNHVFIKDRSSRFVDQVVANVEIEVFQDGDIIIQEADVGDSMYVLSGGEVDICIGPDQTVVARLSKGAVFGEISLLGVSNRRTATVKAVGFCDCRVLHRFHLDKLLKLFPIDREFFEHVAGERLAQLKLARKNFVAPPKSSGRRSSVPAISPALSPSQADHVHATVLRALGRRASDPCSMLEESFSGRSLMPRLPEAIRQRPLLEYDRSTAVAGDHKVVSEDSLPPVVQSSFPSSALKGRGVPGNRLRSPLAMYELDGCMRARTCSKTPVAPKSVSGRRTNSKGYR